MANIHLLDGTRDLKYGKIFLDVLKELVRYQEVSVTPAPGEIDMSGYNYVKSLEKSSYNSARDQCKQSSLLTRIANDHVSRDKQRVIFTEKDLFDEGLNWCFGGYAQATDGQQFVLVSVDRVKNGNHWFDLLAHELGHMYGAASEGRSNTYESLGSHCLNDLCVMKQNLTVDSAIAYANRRHALNAPTFCYQCAEELLR